MTKKLLIFFTVLVMIAAMSVVAFADTGYEKWNGLTDEQKNEIYDLKDGQKQIQNQIIDKYLEWGLLDEEAASEIKNNIEERCDQMRQNGNAPMLGGGGNGFRNGGRAGNCPFTDPAGL